MGMQRLWLSTGIWPRKMKETRVASSHRTDLQAAQRLFRDKQPEQALSLARALQERAPDAEDINRFVQAVLAHLNTLMKLALSKGDPAGVIRCATPLIFEPDYAAAAQPALLGALRQSLSGPERGLFLLDLCRQGVLPDSYWQEIGSVLAELPAEPAMVAAGFEVLRHVPGDTSALLALTVHLATLGHPPASDPQVQERMFDGLCARLDPASAAANAETTRQALYDQARQDLVLPAIAEAQALPDLAPHLALEQAIQRYERPFKASALEAAAPEDVWALLDSSTQDYVLRNPPPLSAAAARILATKARGRGQISLFWRLRIILSLWLRAINFEASQDRIGYLWLVLDPLVHVLIICAVPLFLHAGQIADMNTFPFAVIGACFWLTFRTAATGALSGGGVLKLQLEHPLVRRFDIIVARALSSIIVYFFVGSALMFAAAFAELCTFPVNLPLFLVYFVMVWVMGLSYGIIMHSLAQHYPGVRRINGFMIRVIAFTSGLFYVSEQLPDEIAKIMLWNPLLHIVQLARSCWFYDYTTRDGMPAYALYWMLAMVTLALASLVLDERRPETVRA